MTASLDAGLEADTVGNLLELEKGTDTFACHVADETQCSVPLLLLVNVDTLQRDEELLDGCRRTPFKVCVNEGLDGVGSNATHDGLACCDGDGLHLTLLPQQRVDLAFPRLALGANVNVLLMVVVPVTVCANLC